MSNYKCFNLLISLIVYTLLLKSAAAANGDTNYTQEEKQALEKLRLLVNNELYEDYMRSDIYLIRWLRVKNLNIQSAADALIKSLRWRKVNKLDTILSEDTSKFRKGYPVFTGGVDNEGRPVCVLPIGKWDLRKAALTGQSHLLQRYFYNIVEKEVKMIRDLSDGTGKNITQFILIVDLGGFNIRQQGCLPCLSSYVELIVNLENYYPLMTKTAYLINTPRIFSSIVEPFKPLLSQLSRDVLVVYGVRKEWQRALLEVIPPEQLPRQYGGTKIYQQD